MLGASESPLRYSNIATHMLVEYGYEPILVGKSGQQILGRDIMRNFQPADIAPIHTVTLYLNPLHQPPYYQKLIELKPKRIIFNPGTENEELCLMAQNAGIECLEACTLVMLRSNQF